MAIRCHNDTNIEPILLVIALVICLPCVFPNAVIISVDCLTVLLKDTVDITQLGLSLGIQKDMVEAIKSYYPNDEKALISSHIMNIWLISCTQDPIQQLRDGLNELKLYEVAKQVVLLSSIGIMSIKE